MRNHINYLLPLACSLLLPLSLHANGEELYGKYCKKCHGENGDGDTAMGKKLQIKDYTSADVQAEMTDEFIAEAIKEGVTNDSGRKVMLAFGNKLSDEEVKDLVAYVRSLKKD